MYSVARKRSVIRSLFVVVTVMATIVYIKVAINKPYFINWIASESISCHYVNDGDALPPAEDITPPADSVFFHETSCRGGLNSRQACAVESAARHHPDRIVYVFFNSPISQYVLRRSCLSQLTQLKNVKLARLHIVEYAKGTILGEMLAHRENNRSFWRVEHTADMLRFITLYKYGGVYLDTDMLVVKPLDALGKNWAARENEEGVNIAAMAFGNDELGRSLVIDILNDIKNDYQPYLWSYNGGEALVRSLEKLCNTSVIMDMSAANCRGFEVYDSDVIYPISWDDNSTYFEPGDLPNETWTGASMDQAYTHHLWNRITRSIKVEKDSPYEKLARKHCPTIRQMFGDKFGS